MSIITSLKKQIDELESKILRIQEQCSHPKDAVISKNKGDSGNYDPSQDRYWVEHFCTLCEKTWETDQ